MIQKTIPSNWSFSRLLMLTLLVTLMIAGAGCKSKKKAMEAERAAKEKAKLEQEMADKKQREEEERRMREAEEKARREEAEAKSREEVKGPAAKLDQYFNAIASSTNVASANGSINEALALFASPSTPVLIVISEENGEKDYDRPTTIKDYLNYLKDQKKSINKVGNLQFDGSGKITEVELVKQK
ncbi:MAG TPA: nucleoid-structuring protein H-NS [Cyclobacteriaceae bacterium]